MDPLIRTARTTGVFYLGLGLSGMLGFLLVRPGVFATVEGDTALSSTELAARIADHEGLARAGIALELAVVLTQAMAAVWFFRLFRRIEGFSAGLIAAFGLVNAAAILLSAACLGTAVAASTDPVAGDAAWVRGPLLLSEQLWGVGNLFFGLWLVPMGLCALRSRRMPTLLGRILVVGGAGYVLSAFAQALLPQSAVLQQVLVLPATVGELWMIGYLLIRGLRPAPAPVPAGSSSQSAATVSA